MTAACYHLPSTRSLQKTRSSDNIQISSISSSRFCFITTGRHFDASFASFLRGWSEQKFKETSSASRKPPMESVSDDWREEGFDSRSSAGIGNNSIGICASILRSIRWRPILRPLERQDNRLRCTGRTNALTSSLAYLSSILSSCLLLSILFSLCMFCLCGDQALFSTPLSRRLSRAEKDV